MMMSIPRPFNHFVDCRTLLFTHTTISINTDTGACGLVYVGSNRNTLNALSFTDVDSVCQVFSVWAVNAEQLRVM